jgi:hypothetical protein
VRAIALAVLFPCAIARGELPRGTIKVDVRDAKGAPATAEVSVSPEDGPAAEVKRVGEVYVAEGIVEGVWNVRVGQAAPERVRVKERRVTGVVAVLNAKKAVRYTVSAEERGCDEGTAIEIVAMAKSGLAAGRLEVRHGGRVICAETIAGGGATVHVPPGDYDLSAKLVGGQSAGTHLRYAKRDKPPPSLLLRAK